MKKLQFFMLAFLPLMYSCSKYGNIEGKVLDKFSGEPIAGATVEVKGTILKKNSKENGLFAFDDVVPGIQKIIVSKENYISFSETELIIARGATSKCQDLFLMPKPSSLGLFAISDTLIPIQRFFENSVGKSMNGNIIINDYYLQDVIKLDTINLLLYEGETIQKPSEIYIYSMKFYPLISNSFYGNTPERWISDQVIQDLKVEPIGTSLTQISGKLTKGRYLLRIKQPNGVEEWFFVFDVK